MIQRVGIAQALLRAPKILIMDEPTAGLDPKERVRFRKILTSLSSDKIVIISTHIVSDVEFTANHIIMLKDKQIFANDSGRPFHGDHKMEIPGTLCSCLRADNWDSGGWGTVSAGEKEGLSFLNLNGYRNGDGNRDGDGGIVIIYEWLALQHDI